MKHIPMNKIENKFEILIDNEQQKIIHLSLKKDEILAKHNVPYLLNVVLVLGRINFSGNELMPGSLMILDPKEEHELKAKEDSELLLIQNKF